MTKKIKIGELTLEVSDQHIYLSDTLPPTYDYVPWNLIGELVRRWRLSNPRLIDIGANVGDTAAHFRRHSSAPITCIEPSDLFYEILERNASRLGDVALIKKLFVPTSMVGNVSFYSGGQTGGTDPENSGQDKWKGESIGFSELLQDETVQYLIKTDTDGFDLHIIKSLLGFLDRFDVPLIFFEGPLQHQLERGELDEWFALFSKLQTHGYNLLLLTNYGMPFVFAGTDFSAVRSAFNSMTTSLRMKRALFHYFDIVAVRQDRVNELVQIKEPWPPEVLGS